MPIYSSAWLEQVLVQKQTDLRTILNSSGTWTSTGTALLRHQSCSLSQNKPIVPTPYKTGDRSTLIGAAGRRSGGFSLNVPIIPNGAAGTVPDSDLIFQGAFGQPATIVAATSVTYNFLDQGFIPLALFRYDLTAGGSTSYFSGGSIIQRLTINLNGEYLSMSAEGKSVCVSDSAQFSSYTGNDAVAKFGLTTFPAHPNGLTTNGNPINGFGGVATFDSNVMAELRGSPSIVISTGLDFAEDGFSDGYPFAITGGRRQVSSSTLSFADDDGSALNNLKVKAFTKAPINISLQVNTTAGSIMTINLNNVQLGAQSLVENGNLFDIRLGDSLAHESSVGSVNDCTIVFT